MYYLYPFHAMKRKILFFPCLCNHSVFTGVGISCCCGCFLLKSLVSIERVKRLSVDLIRHVPSIALVSLQETSTPPPVILVHLICFGCSVREMAGKGLSRDVSMYFPMPPV